MLLHFDDSPFLYPLIIIPAFVVSSSKNKFIAKVLQGGSLISSSFPLWIQNNQLLVRIGLSIAAALLLGAAVFTNGPAISNMSVNQAAAAISLTHDQGFQTYWGLPFVEWPPLYPLVLAIGLKLNFNVWQWAALINVCVIAGITYASWSLFRLLLEDIRIVFYGSAAVAFSAPILQVASFALVDLSYYLLCLLFLNSILRLYMSWSTFDEVVSLALAAILAMTRYTGPPFVCGTLAGFMILLILEKRKIRWRFIPKIFFSMMIPLGIWVFRNFQLTGTYTGPRSYSRISLGENVQIAIDWITSWFVPISISFFLRIAFVLIPVLFLIGISLFRFERDRNQIKSTINGPSLLVFVSAVCYLGFIILTASRVDLDPISNRFLGAVLVFILALALVGGERLWRLFKNKFPDKMGRYAVTAAMVFMLSYWILRACFLTVQTATTGPGGLNTQSRRDSETVAFVRNLPSDTTIYSDEPRLLFLLAGHRARSVETCLPMSFQHLGIQHSMKNDKVYVVLFKKEEKPTSACIRERSGTQNLTRLEDGLVLKIN